MPRIKNLLYTHDYEDIAASFEKAEQDAIEAVKSFAKTNKDILIYIARWGDGNCGYIAELISEELGMKKYQAERYRKKVISKKIKREVIALHGDKCLRCGSGNDVCMDHVIPESLGGDTSVSNLQPLCRSCNSSKALKENDYRKQKTR